MHGPMAASRAQTFGASRESRLAPSQGGNQDELARLDVVRSTAQHSTAVPKRRSCSISLACGSSWRDLASALLLNHGERLGQTEPAGLIHLHQTDSDHFQSACLVG